jgi:hypothetical protein
MLQSWRAQSHGGSSETPSAMPAKALDLQHPTP